MRPLNSKQRRSQFLIFIGLFLLAMIPVVVLVYLQGRVDQSENKFLRMQYHANLASGRSRAEDRARMDKLRNDVHALADFVSTNSPDMLDLVKDYSRTIADKVDAISTLPLNDQSTPADTTINKLVADLKTAMGTMKEVYKKGLAANDKAKQQEKDMDKLQKDLEKAQNSFH